MLEELEKIREKYNQLITSLSNPEILSDPQRLKRISKQRAELEPVVHAYDDYLRLQTEVEESEVLLKESAADPDMRQLAEEELEKLRPEQDRAERELKLLLLPKDPNDDRDIFLEIRAGAGGDEASLFAQDLYRMYSRFAERKGWRLEVMSSSSSSIKGFKEIIVSIRGNRVYSRLKYESGVHRVQRVPQTEASGRIHTSTVTVAVLAEADDVDVQLDSKDLRVEAFGASGPGGQNVNRNYTAIRVTHLPSNMVVSCQDEKSQHRNKEKALRILRSRLMDIAQNEQQEEISQHRKSQVGTGKRSEKIRTYNFPQSRVTDHRLGISIHQLEAFLDGQLDELIEALRIHFQAKMIGRAVGSAD